MKKIIPLENGWQLEKPDGNGWLDIAVMPSEVYEILCSHGEIGDEYLIGIAEDTKWVAERDWTYRLAFKADKDARSFLRFDGLDTIANIYLNGEHIAYSEDFYLPLRTDVTGKLKADNLLEIKFHSPYKYMEENPLPKEWEGKFGHNKIIRKPGHDFSGYLGQRPYITQIGVSGEIFLETVDTAEITRCDIAANLDAGYKSGNVSVKLFTDFHEGIAGTAEVFAPDGKNLGNRALEIAKDNGGVVLSTLAPVNSPELWWPRGYGEQPLYTVKVTLTLNGETVDMCEKRVGFRDIRMNINFELDVNGRRIRLWGSNIAPIDGKARRWNGERAKTLLDLAEMANMNTLRIWGEGDPIDDRFYRECDERGILVWQEFFHYYGMQPDNEHFNELCRKEGEYLVNKLKHHACIFMWCGGNEGFMGAEFEHPDKPYIGGATYLEIYPKLIAELDPGRYYHPNSPYGGPFSNCPTVGDTHGYEMWWYSPGTEYAVAFTEQMRASGAAVKSLKRFIPEDELWPDDFVDSTAYSKRNVGLMPKAWEYRAGGMLDLKSGPVALFRDADSPYEMAYKYSAAHAFTFKTEIERSRMGRPSGTEKRISNCHLIWKLSDTWPLIYSAIIDYYLEPFIPYYMAKRCYSPIWVCFDVRDTINLWLVNDSAHDTKGTVKVGLFNPKSNKFLGEKEAQASMSSGCSGEVMNLDFLGSFRTENILYVKYEDKENGIDCSNYHLMDIERRLIFPEARLTISADKDILTITTDQYAHCVELSGNDNGDEFGFYFEDNFFNLLPGETKRVRINGRHKHGRISAKAHYSPHVSSLDWGF